MVTAERAEQRVALAERRAHAESLAARARDEEAAKAKVEEVKRSAKLKRNANDRWNRRDEEGKPLRQRERMGQA